MCFSAKQISFYAPHQLLSFHLLWRGCNQDLGFIPPAMTIQGQSGLYSPRQRREAEKPHLFIISEGWPAFLHHHYNFGSSGPAGSHWQFPSPCWELEHTGEMLLAILTLPFMAISRSLGSTPKRQSRRQLREQESQQPRETDSKTLQGSKKQRAIKQTINCCCSLSVSIWKQIFWDLCLLRLHTHLSKDNFSSLSHTLTLKFSFFFLV